MLRALGFCLALFSIAIPLSADDKPAAAPNPKPAIKALFLAGGCCHDYKKLPTYIGDELAKKIPITLDVRMGVDPLKDPHFGEGYDLIIYDFCYADEKDPDVINRAVNTIKEGKPAVMIHCAMHTFRNAGDLTTTWTTAIGMRTHMHDPFRSFSTRKMTKDHPILKGFPDDFTTAGDELYNTDKLYDGVTPLLNAKTKGTDKDHTVAWCQEYGKGRVFGTTLGHDMKTVGTPEYIQLLSQGILWSLDKLDKDGNPAAGYSVQAEKGK